MQLADEVSFEIYFRKFEEIKFPKNHSKIFWWKVPKNDDKNRALARNSKKVLSKDVVTSGWGSTSRLTANFVVEFFPAH